MAVELTLLSGAPLELMPGLPFDYTGPVISGAVAVNARNNFGGLALQELTGENYSIRFTIGKFLKRVRATGWIHARGLYSCFMLQSGTRKHIESLGKQHLRENHYTSFFTEPTGCSALFEKNEEFRAIDFFYSPRLVEELLPFFPELKAILESSGMMIPPQARRILPCMNEIIQQILHCPYNEQSRQFYFDLKVRELLYQTFEITFNQKKRVYHFNPSEVRRIHEAKAILEKHISQKPPSIRSLSRQVALNEFKLKIGFRKYFHAGMSEWLHEQKMLYSHHLILTTNKPVKEICLMVGYPLTTNFITAFRKYFGYTPASLRK